MKYYLTTPIYYINDRPHAGTAYTTVAADVIARYHRSRGDETFFLAGTAEHGAKIAARAEKEGLSPADFCDRNAQYFIDAWQTLAISYDDFIRTTQARHTEAVNVYFTKLKASGKLYEKDYQGLYCVGCESFKHEKDLVDGLCPDHQVAPDVVTERNWFFRLSDYADQIEQLIVDGALRIEPDSRRNEVLSFIRQGLEDIAVSRSRAKVPWAIPLPWDDTQVIYVWCEELFNYCSAIGYAIDQARFAAWWPANVHIVGKDILRFHAVIWPALLLAIGESLPAQIYAHGHFTVNGQKMSKSLGNSIDPRELAREFGSDGARYLLLAQMPFGADGDIKTSQFVTQYNADLANGIGNLASRVLAMVEKYCAGAVPTVAPEDWQAELVSMWQRYDQAFERLALDQAIAILKELTARCDAFIEQRKPWQLAKDPAQHPQLEATLATLLEAVRQVGLMSWPIMPTTGSALNNLFDIGWEGRPLAEARVWGQLPPAGTVLTHLEALFPRHQNPAT